MNEDDQPLCDQLLQLLLNSDGKPVAGTQTYPLFVEVSARAAPLLVGPAPDSEVNPSPAPMRHAGRPK